MKSRLFSLLLIWAFVPLASAQEASPVAFVKGLSEDVIAAIRQDKDIQAGDADKISALVEAKILPHFDFRRTTQVAMGVNWRRASADQQERLTSEFKLLLVRTYSGALASYRDQTIEFKPARASPGDSEVTVRSQVRQSGAEPLTIDLRNGKDRVGLENLRCQHWRDQLGGELPDRVRRGGAQPRRRRPHHSACRQEPPGRGQAEESRVNALAPDNGTIHGTGHSAPRDVHAVHPFGCAVARARSRDGNLRDPLRHLRVGVASHQPAAPDLASESGYHG